MMPDEPQWEDESGQRQVAPRRYVYLRFMLQWVGDGARRVVAAQA